MTTPGPLSLCSSQPPPPECVRGGAWDDDGCSDCARCGFEPCACLRELRRGVFELIADDADLELPDELALGGMLRAGLPFKPHLMYIPRDELHGWLPGVRDARDSEAIAEALIEEAFRDEFVEPEPPKRRSYPRNLGRPARSPQREFDDDADGFGRELPLSDGELYDWARAEGISRELFEAVSDIRDTRLFAGEPSGHGGHAGGDTRRSGSTCRLDLLLGRGEREPERSGHPVSRARSVRRAAGGLARRAKPQGRES